MATRIDLTPIDPFVELRQRIRIALGIVGIAAIVIVGAVLAEALKDPRSVVLALGATVVVCALFLTLYASGELRQRWLWKSLRETLRLSAAVEDGKVGADLRLTANNSASPSRANVDLRVVSRGGQERHRALMERKGDRHSEDEWRWMMEAALPLSISSDDECLIVADVEVLFEGRRIPMRQTFEWRGIKLDMTDHEATTATLHESIEETRPHPR